MVCLHTADPVNSAILSGSLFMEINIEFINVSAEFTQQSEDPQFGFSRNTQSWQCCHFYIALILKIRWINY